MKIEDFGEYISFQNKEGDMINLPFNQENFLFLIKNVKNGLAEISINGLVVVLISWLDNKKSQLKLVYLNKKIPESIIINSHCSWEEIKMKLCYIKNLRE